MQKQIQLEGRISVLAALEARQRKIHLILLKSGIQETTARPILELAEQQNVSVKYASTSELERMAHGKTHGGVLALCAPREKMAGTELLGKLVEVNESPFLLLLEGIDDEQNLGFTLRTAEAVGVHAVLLKKHLWNFDETAVSRASSGAFERMPVVLFDEADKLLPKLQRLNIKVFGCIANVKRTMYDIDLQQPVVLAVGGEKRGLSAAVRVHCDAFIRIPMIADMGSLSLSHAAAILLAETMRQRRHENK